MISGDVSFVVICRDQRETATTTTDTHANVTHIHVSMVDLLWLLHNGNENCTIICCTQKIGITLWAYYEWLLQIMHDFVLYYYYVVCIWLGPWEKSACMRGGMTTGGWWSLSRMNNFSLVISPAEFLSLTAFSICSTPSRVKRFGDDNPQFLKCHT